jgi:hypothetical protein
LIKKIIASILILAPLIAAAVLVYNLSPGVFWTLVSFYSLGLGSALLNAEAGDE